MNIKPLEQVFGEQANQVRQDVERLGCRLMRITDAIEKIRSDEKRISNGIRQVSFAQARFNDRVDSIRGHLHATKSFLAFLKS